jgi:DNA-binding MarR family transcriptional regulator
VNEVSSPSTLAELMASLHGVEARLEEALGPTGLSLGKFGLLSNLVAAGEPLPLRALAERCACVRSNITQLVDRLEADGLVIREADPQDRRSVRAGLTAKGRTRHAAASLALAEAERDVLAPLSEPQRDLLVTLLRSLRSGQ